MLEKSFNSSVTRGHLTGVPENMVLELQLVGAEERGSQEVD